MKKAFLNISVIVLVIILSISLVACGDNTKSSKEITVSTNSSSVTQTETPSNSDYTQNGDFRENKNLSSYCNVDAIFPLIGNWYYSTSSGEKDEYIEGIFNSIYPEYVSVFSEQAMQYKPVIIFNNPDEPNPVTSPLGDVTIITLSQDKTSYWSQLIFQLSHEMTHYAYFSLTPDVDIFKGDWDDMNSVWNEEIICEAMSLYMLDFLSTAENWDKCSLSDINPGFYTANKEYLEDEYNDTAGSFPFNEFYCTPDEFQMISDFADENRGQHSLQRNLAYDLFVEYGNSVIGEVLDMYSYYNADYDYIYYDEWAKNAKNNEFITKLSDIQLDIKSK